MGPRFGHSLMLVVAACGCGERSVRRTIPVAVPDAVVEQVEPTVPDEVPWDSRQGSWAAVSAAPPVSIRWSTQLSGPITRPIGLLKDGVVAVTAGSVHRMGKDGQLAWTAQISADGIPRLTEQGVLVANQNGVMSVVDPVSGSIVASHGGVGRVASAPLVLDGRLRWLTVGGVLMGIDGLSEELLPGPVSDAASSGGRLIAGNIHGDIVGYSKTLEPWASSAPGPVIGHPVVDRDTVYVPFGSSEGRPGGVVALSLASGERLWTTTVDFEPGAAPALGRHLFVPDKAGDLVALDRVHGGVRWRAPGRAPFTMQPLVSGAMVIAGDASGRLHSFDVDDGGTIWTIDLESAVTGEGVIMNDSIVVGTASGRVVCVGS